MKVDLYEICNRERIFLCTINLPVLPRVGDVVHYKNTTEGVATVASVEHDYRWLQAKNKGQGYSAIVLLKPKTQKNFFVVTPK